MVVFSLLINDKRDFYFIFDINIVTVSSHYLLLSFGRLYNRIPADIVVLSFSCKDLLLQKVLFFYGVDIFFIIKSINNGTSGFSKRVDERTCPRRRNITDFAWSVKKPLVYIFYP